MRGKSLLRQLRWYRTRTPSRAGGLSVHLKLFGMDCRVRSELADIEVLTCAEFTTLLRCQLFKPAQEQTPLLRRSARHSTEFRSDPPQPPWTAGQRRVCGQSLRPRSS